MYWENSMYFFFLSSFLLPVTPSEVDISVNNKNETVSLINDGEINVLKNAGLKDVRFQFMIPAQSYPFAHYHMPGLADVALRHLESLKKSKKPFQFIISRMNRQTFLSATNIKVSLENYEIIESAENGLDLIISIVLKEYREYSTKRLIVENNVVSVAKTRG